MGDVVDLMDYCCDKARTAKEAADRAFKLGLHYKANGYNSTIDRYLYFAHKIDRYKQEKSNNTGEYEER